MTVPSTTAGRLHIKHWHPIGDGLTDLDLAQSILAIEAEAARAERERIVALLRAAGADGGLIAAVKWVESVKRLDAAAVEP